MGSDNKQRKIDFPENLSDQLNNISNCDNKIAELERELDNLKTTKAKSIQLASRIASNYYTEEKISEIYQEGVDILKSPDCFNVDDYISASSNSSEFTLEKIILLRDIIDTINETKAEIEINNNPTVPSKSNKFWHHLCDIFLKEGEHNDG